LGFENGYYEGYFYAEDQKFVQVYIEKETVAFYEEEFFDWV